MNTKASSGKGSCVKPSQRRAAASRMLLLLLLLTLPAVVQAQFTFTNNNGAITITGYTGTNGAVVIPDMINGLPVTTIGGYYVPGVSWFGAFEGNRMLTNVTIGTNVTSIGDHAFANCYSLVSVTIGNSVTSIRDLAFYSCASLTKVTIPNSVTSIGDNAFAWCYSLTNIIIPDSVTSIGDYAFMDCYFLANVTIGKNVTNLGEGAFEGCFSLTNVTIPNDVTSIRQLVFDGCTRLTSVTIPEGVTNIGRMAFSGCALTTITIGNSVISIGNGAFYWCTSLTNVTIPSAVTNIDAGAFRGCTNLMAVYFNGNAPSLGSGAGPGQGDSVFCSNPYTPCCQIIVYPPATIYYLPGTTGWGASFGGLPTALWLLPNPLILKNGHSFGVQSNGFGFMISWATNIPVVVEASTNLVKPTWFPISTNTLTSGLAHFSDPQWTNYPARFYRIRSQ